jgi:signal transduction histidine kinase
MSTIDAQKGSPHVGGLARESGAWNSPANLTMIALTVLALGALFYVELDDNARVAFYRAIRELLLNVVKHAGVKEARVRISREGGMARIAVEDSGVGMPPRAKRHGFGLLALRDRLEQLGGTLETRGTGSPGTTVVVSLPISPRFE